MSKAELQQMMANSEEDNSPVKMYLEDNFKEYVKENYLVENPELLKNETIMQMVYALEWYDIPRTAYSELIQFHPYLTKIDADKLHYVNTQHQLENGLGFGLFTIITNRFLSTKTQLFKRRVLRFPAACGFGGLVAYLFNIAILRPIYLKDVTELGLVEKYFYLDLNADLMKEDLAQFGFKIDAKHFNLEQTEQRLQQKQQQAEESAK